MKPTTLLSTALLMLPLLAACDNATGNLLDGEDSSMSSSVAMIDGDSSSVMIIDLTASSSLAPMGNDEAMSAASVASSGNVQGEQAQGAAYIAPGCKVAGCSAQLCVEEGMEDMMTTCEWREEYACYKTARCEKQTTGVCGWTMDAQLTSCLQTGGSGESDIPPADSVQ